MGFGDQDLRCVGFWFFIFWGFRCVVSEFVGFRVVDVDEGGVGFESMVGRTNAMRNVWV